MDTNNIRVIQLKANTQHVNLGMENDYGLELSVWTISIAWKIPFLHALCVVLPAVSVLIGFFSPLC